MAAANTTRSTERWETRPTGPKTSFTDSTLFPATKHLGSAPHRHPNRRGTLLPETTNPAGFPLPWCQCGKASSPTTRNSASSQTPRVARTNTDRSSRRMIATVANAPPTITVARPPRTPKSDTGRGLRDAFGMRIRSQTIPASSGLTGAVQRIRFDSAFWTSFLDSSSPTPPIGAFGRVIYPDNIPNFAGLPPIGTTATMTGGAQAITAATTSSGRAAPFSRDRSSEGQRTVDPSDQASCRA